MLRSIIASVAAASAVALVSAAPATAANQALVVSGLGGAAMPDMLMSEVLGGMFGSYERHGIPWPQPSRPFGPIPVTLGGSVMVGAENLDAAITDALTRIGPGEHVTVIGLSAGALVVDEQLRRLAAGPDAPDKSQLNFVVVGDSSRFSFNENRHDKFLDFTYTAPAETKYDTTVVAAQYDGFADYPDRQWNLLAIANAIAGEMLLHVPSMFGDLSDAPADVSVTSNELGGVTTSYLIRNDNLPLVQLLPLLVFGQDALKDIIDSAYVRHDDTSIAASTAAPVEAPVEAVAEDTAAVSLPDCDEAAADPASDPASASASDETTDPVAAGDPTQDPVDGPTTDSLPGRKPAAATATATNDNGPSAERSPGPRSSRTGRGSAPNDG